MKHLGFLSLVLMVGLACVFSGVASAQEDPQPSPEEWRKLSLAEFVGEIDRLTSGDQPLSEQVWNEIRSQSAERLVEAVGTGVQADYHDLVSLYLWGNQNLTARQRETVLAGLSSPGAQVSAWTFDKMRSAHQRMNQAAMPKDSIHALVLAWVGNRDIRSLADVDAAGWLFQQVHIIDREETAAREFSVRWTGAVQAPADGEYTFSICPINLNFEHFDMFRRQTTAVWIDNQKILDSTKDGWTFKGDPVSLKAGQKTPIRVELSYNCSSREVFEERPAVAMLMWEASGMQRRVVPASALSPGEGEGNGLQAEYRLVENGQPRAVTRIDPQINYIWYHGSYVVPTHAELRSRLAGELWAYLVDPATLAAWETEGKARQSDWMGAWWAFLESLSTARQKEWVEQLLAHPALVEQCPARTAANLYRRCRIGAPDEAITLLSQWARSHPDAESVFAAEYYKTNRDLFRDLSGRIVWDYPPHLEALETRSLELPDGRCCLPVAYTLAYGYWVQGRIRAWIDKLEARLNDETLTGDRRVNWLLARAQAEEIRRSQPGRQWLTVERLLAGEHWLQEACLVAQSEPVRLRAYKELATRLAAEERLDRARKMLDSAATRCTAASSAETVAAWRKQLDQLADSFDKHHQELDAAAEQAHIEILRQRYRRAVDRGDQEAASRYEKLLNDAGAKIE